MNNESNPYRQQRTSLQEVYHKEAIHLIQKLRHILDVAEQDDLNDLTGHWASISISSNNLNNTLVSLKTLKCHCI
jgi:hypothetical protein